MANQRCHSRSFSPVSPSARNQPLTEATTANAAPIQMQWYAKSPTPSSPRNQFHSMATAPTITSARGKCSTSGCRCASTSSQACETGSEVACAMNMFAILMHRRCTRHRSLVHAHWPKKRKGVSRPDFAERPRPFLRGATIRCRIESSPHPSNLNKGGRCVPTALRATLPKETDPLVALNVVGFQALSSEFHPSRPNPPHIFA